MEAIRLDKVTRSYRVGDRLIRAVDDLTLGIEEGEFTTLVGPSGSGKTTLLQLMGCLDKPDSGTITIKGQDVTRASAGERADMRRDKIGFIFQFFALIPVLTAYENVELPLLLAGVGAGERASRVGDLLKAVDMSDRAQHRPDQLSGGEQQRTAIARALATRPVIVLADEPTANLDTANGRQAMEIMQRLNADTGTAFVFATHDPRVVSFARRIVALRDGRLDSGPAIAAPGVAASSASPAA